MKRRVKKLLIYLLHTHADHSPAAAKPLAKLTGAVIMGYGPHGEEEGEEGADLNFTPDYINQR